MKRRRQAMTRLLALLALALLAACGDSGGSSSGAATAGARAAPAASVGYVPVSGEGAVYVVDPRENRVLRKIADVGTHPTILRVTPDHSKVYVLNFGPQPPWEVSVISTASDTVIEKIPVAGVTYASFVIAPDGRHAYVPSDAPDHSTVDVIDTATDAVTQSFVLPRGLVAIEISPDGHTLYLVYDDASVGAYDADTGAELKPRIGVGGVFPTWVNITRDGGKLYTVNLDDSLGVIDTQQWRLLGTIATGSGSGPLVGTITPDGRELYMSNVSSHELLVVDTRTDQVARRIPTGDVPVTISFSPDGQRGYLSTLGQMSPLILPGVGVPEMLFFMFTAGPALPGELVTYELPGDTPVSTLPLGTGAGISVFF